MREALSNTMVFALLAVAIVAIKLGTLMALTLVKDGRRHALTEQLHKA